MTSGTTPSFQRPLRIPERIALCTASPAFARAGDQGTWRLPLVLADAVAPGGKVYLYVFGGRNSRGQWENLQIDEPSGDGYVSLATADGEALPPTAISENGGLVVFAAPKAVLPAGAELTAELARAIAPKYSQANKFYLLLSGLTGEALAPPVLNEEGRRLILAACMMRITGDETARLRVFAPSQAAAGEPVALLVRPEDRSGNMAAQAPGPLTVRLGEREIAAERTPVEGTTCCRLGGITLSEPGVHRLRVTERETGLAGVSNPIHCAAQPTSPGVLWGMIHGHTEISDGAGTLHDYFAYMRDACGLDFGAPGDHDHLWETTDAMHALTQRAAAEHDEPGRFTVFLGYEWAKWRQNGDGDRNVYYLHDHRPMYRSDDGHYPTPGDLFSALKNETAIIIPHHSANWGNHCDWKDHDTEKERLVEIYSRWGNSERGQAEGNPFPITKGATTLSWEVPDGFVQRALALGWRVGFTAGGDDHYGHPGDDMPGYKYPAGLLAVWAEENTREAIWRALWNRQCYGTTGARMLLDVRVDGRPMGSELRLSEHPDLAARRTLAVRVHGTDRLRAVEIVRNNREVETREADGADLVFEWTDTAALSEVNLPAAPHCPTPFTFYYVRVTQADGQMAWASPVWIRP